MKKIIKISLTFIFIITLLIICTIYVKNNHYIMLYIDKNNDTSSYPYLAKISDEINKVLANTIKLTNNNVLGIKTKLIYTDVYGSGVLKNNKTSSDMDYGVGIYLGEFIYNGKNSKQIAKNILRAINSYNFNLLYEIDNSDVLYRKNQKYTLLGFKKDNTDIINTLAIGVENTISEKPYRLDVGNRYFYMQPDELLLKDYNYIKIFTDGISYSANYRKMLRELSISTAYYADIINENTGESKHVKIIEETFNGRRFQADYRQFVPHVYTDILSFDFVNNIVPDDNEKYIKMRLGDYYRHHKDIRFINGAFDVSPLKVVKRILQCADILAPIIPKDKLEEIHKSSYKVLSDETITLINDYYIGCSVLSDILTSDSLSKKIFNDNKITNLINETDNIIKKLAQNENIKNTELIPLIEYQQSLNNNINDLQRLKEFNKKNFERQEIYLNKLMAAHITNRKSFIEYSKYLDNLLRTAGIRTIRLYQDIDNHNIVYVIKDNDSKGISLDEFPKLDLDNGHSTYLYDENTVFKFIDEKDFKGDMLNIDYCRIRYKTTKTEDKIWQNIKDKLIKDKKNYNMKIRFGIIKS